MLLIVPLINRSRDALRTLREVSNEIAGTYVGFFCVIIQNNGALTNYIYIPSFHTIATVIVISETLDTINTTP